MLQRILLKELFPSNLIRIGLAFVFFYAAISEFLHPQKFYNYIPTFIDSLFPKEIFLLFFSLFEILLALWILSRIQARASAAFATLTICMITLFNLESFEVVFRNISILFSALALFFLDKDTSSKPSQPSQAPVTQQQPPALSQSASKQDQPSAR